MAAVAQMKQSQRNVEVRRETALEILKTNRTKHVEDYNEALAGYKDQLLQRVDAAYEKATEMAKNRYSDLKSKISNLTLEECAEQPAHFELVKSQTVKMPVPKSYESDYDAAIDIMRHDVRDTLKLSFAEFNCFMRNEWEWQSDFSLVNSMYASAAH